ncbi:MAG: dephospho-CoA kinase, partial [Duncaniella sp.]|nr:dephospho-CoA kinase [Duncaniella sp.]
ALWLAGLDRKTAFVETAILYESGLDRMVDCVWEVSAPTELRIERVMRRSALTEGAVIARIKAQESTIVDTPHPHIIKLINDGVSPLLPQIEKALEKTWQ